MAKGYIFSLNLLVQRTGDLTITRPAEAAKARSSEIDLDKKLWTITADRMKMNRIHNILLCFQDLNILEIMKPINGHREHIFPSMKSPYNKPMNSQTINAVIKRIGFAGRFVAHEFRSIASTALNVEEFDPDAIEAALAHIDSNEEQRANNRAVYLEQRTKMMQWWGDFIEKARLSNK